MIYERMNSDQPVQAFFTIDDAQSGGIRHEEAVFAGGCFWCIESAFDGVEGVISAVSGYMGGEVKNPSYDEVSTGMTGHLEAVKVLFDPSRVPYESLLDIFWRRIDPTDDGGQFADRGSQYRTAIFYTDETQKRKAESSRDDLIRSRRFDRPVVTSILKASVFYPAEEYLQKYCRRKPEEYHRYSRASGREGFIERVWGGVNKESSCSRGSVDAKDQLKKTLSPLQWSVMMENGTEPAFENEYWNEKRAGLYVDRISGQPLFLSCDKFDSGTGWPSFARPADSANVVERIDDSGFMRRIEVRSSSSDAHLGHLFSDGPAPQHHRYCINSAALRFVPREDMEKEGYGLYLHDLPVKTA